MSFAQTGKDTGSSDVSRAKVKKTDKTRRIWLQVEEEHLVASLKELVAQGLKSDNGFRAGYLNKLEDAMKKKFPDTDIKGTPHIHSRISTWKKNYYSLTQMLSLSGIGLNPNGMIECVNDQWDQIVKMDSNARLMRHKSWPFFEDWKEIFGKDRATGDSAEDVMDAVNDLIREQNYPEDDYQVNLEDFNENEGASDNVSQSQKVNQAPKAAGKRRKTNDGLQGVCEILGEISRNTNARLDILASRIGYEFDVSKTRKEMLEQLGNIPGLSIRHKFAVCDILGKEVDRLEIFMAMPEEDRPIYVQHLLGLM